MARNIEIKARVSLLPALRTAVEKLADKGPVEINQDDTFFHCTTGRLKVRAFPDGTGQLIFYQRANQPGPKESFYELSHTDMPDALRATLTLAYGQTGRVRKHRTLFEIGRTRVHLDEVEGLGSFLELEVVLPDGEPVEEGVREAHALMLRLGVDAEMPIDAAHVDLIA